MFWSTPKFNFCVHVDPNKQKFDIIELEVWKLFDHKTHYDMIEFAAYRKQQTHKIHPIVIKMRKQILSVRVQN